MAEFPKIATKWMSSVFGDAATLTLTTPLPDAAKIIAELQDNLKAAKKHPSVVKLYQILLARYQDLEAHPDTYEAKSVHGKFQNVEISQKHKDFFVSLIDIVRDGRKHFNSAEEGFISTAYTISLLMDIDLSQFKSLPALEQDTVRGINETLIGLLSKEQLETAHELIYDYDLENDLFNQEGSPISAKMREGYKAWKVAHKYLFENSPKESELKTSEQMQSMLSRARSTQDAATDPVAKKYYSLIIEMLDYGRTDNPNTKSFAKKVSALVRFAYKNYASLDDAQKGDIKYTLSSMFYYADGGQNLAALDLKNLKSHKREILDHIDPADWNDLFRLAHILKFTDQIYNAMNIHMMPVAMTRGYKSWHKNNRDWVDSLGSESQVKPEDLTEAGTEQNKVRKKLADLQLRDVSTVQEAARKYQLMFEFMALEFSSFNEEEIKIASDTVEAHIGYHSYIETSAEFSDIQKRSMKDEQKKVLKTFSTDGMHNFFKSAYLTGQSDDLADAMIGSSFPGNMKHAYAVWKKQNQIWINRLDPKAVITASPVEDTISPVFKKFHQLLGAINSVDISTKVHARHNSNFFKYVCDEYDALKQEGFAVVRKELEALILFKSQIYEAAINDPGLDVKSSIEKFKKTFNHVSPESASEYFKAIHLYDLVNEFEGALSISAVPIKLKMAYGLWKKQNQKWIDTLAKNSGSDAMLEATGQVLGDSEYNEASRLMRELYSVLISDEMTTPKIYARHLGSFLRHIVNERAPLKPDFGIIQDNIKVEIFSKSSVTFIGNPISDLDKKGFLRQQKQMLSHLSNDNEAVSDFFKAMYLYDLVDTLKKSIEQGSIPFKLQKAYESWKNQNQKWINRLNPNFAAPILSVHPRVEEKKVSVSLPDNPVSEAIMLSKMKATQTTPVGDASLYDALQKDEAPYVIRTIKERLQREDLSASQRKIYHLMLGPDDTTASGAYYVEFIPFIKCIAENPADFDDFDKNLINVLMAPLVRSDGDAGRLSRERLKTLPHESQLHLFRALHLYGMEKDFYQAKDTVPNKMRSDFRNWTMANRKWVESLSVAPVEVLAPAVETAPAVAVADEQVSGRDVVKQNSFYNFTDVDASFDIHGFKGALNNPDTSIGQRKLYQLYLDMYSSSEAHMNLDNFVRCVAENYKDFSEEDKKFAKVVLDVSFRLPLPDVLIRNRLTQAEAVRGKKEKLQALPHETMLNLFRALHICDLEDEFVNAKEVVPNKMRMDFRNWTMANRKWVESLSAVPEEVATLAPAPGSEPVVAVVEPEAQPQLEPVIGPQQAETGITYIDVTHSLIDVNSHDNMGFSPLRFGEENNEPSKGFERVDIGRRAVVEKMLLADQIPGNAITVWRDTSTTEEDAISPYDLIDIRTDTVNVRIAIPHWRGFGTFIIHNPAPLDRHQMIQTAELRDNPEVWTLRYNNEEQWLSGLQRLAYTPTAQLDLELKHRFNLQNRKQEVIDTVIAVLMTTGELPSSSDKTAFTCGPLAGKTTPSRVYGYLQNGHIKGMDGLTTYNILYKALVEKNPALADFLNKDTISARDVFNDCAQFIAENDIVPEREWYEFFTIGGRNPGAVAEAFRAGAVKHLDEFVPGGYAMPKTMDEFLVMTGLAVKQNGQLVPGVMEYIAV